MFDMRFKTPERRSLVFALKELLKIARQERKGHWPVEHNCDYWTIKVVRKNKKK